MIGDRRNLYSFCAVVFDIDTASSGFGFMFLFSYILTIENTQRFLKKSENQDIRFYNCTVRVEKASLSTT